MATVILDDGSLYDIADAIRSKLGVSTTYLPREMAAAIMAIETSSVVEGYYYNGGFYEDSAHTSSITGEAEKLYVDLSDGGLYRWNGSAYVEIASSLSLGETSDTAYRGDRGKVAYDHAQAKGSAFSSGLYKVTTNSEGHVTNATAVQKSDITGLGIPAQDTTYSNATTSSSGLMSGSDKSKLDGIASGATANTASTATPLMDGTASAGSSDAYARGDHRHPTDTSRASTATATTSANGLMSSSDKSKLDSIDTSALATATANANNAAQSANTAATAANTAASGANDAADRAEDALDAIGDISEQAVPLMSESTRGGAKLGHGLTVEDGALGIGEVTDPTDAGPIVELTADGWAEQMSTTGKNLLPNNAVTATNNGVTFTVNADGSVTANGTVSGNYATLILLNTAGMQDLPIIGKAATLTLSGCPSGGGSNTYQIVANFSDGETSFAGMSDSGSGATRTYMNVQRQSAGNIYIRIYGSGTTVSNLTFYPQLELGSTATPYEPYSGAAPSPSPSYPQEIRRCRGRNLLHLASDLPQTLNGVTISNASNGHVKVNGTASANTNRAFAMFDAVAGETYFITIPNTTNKFNFFIWDDVGSKMVASSKTAAFAFTAPATQEYMLAISAQSGAVFNNFIMAAQVERDSEQHAFVPHGYVGIDTTHDLMTYDYLSDVYITSSDGLSGAAITTLVQGGSHLWVVDLGEMRDTLMLTQVGGDRCRIAEFDSYPKAGVTGFMHAYFDTTWWQDTTVAHYVTFTPTRRYVAFFCAAVGTASGVGFEPHPPVSLSLTTTIPIPLPSRGWVAALPDGTCDTLTLDGAGGYVWTENVKELVFDGVNVKTNGGVTNGAGVQRYYHVLADAAVAPANNATLPDVYASHFVRQTTGYSWGNSGSCVTIINATNIGFLHDSLEGVAFNTWLQSNPVTVLYPLATPTTERGYVDMPTVPAHASISCPDLTDLAVRCCADEGAAEIAGAWGKRYESRIKVLEMTVAELVAGA